MPYSTLLEALMQHPGTAWYNASRGHCPLSQGAKLQRLGRPLDEFRDQNLEDSSQESKETGNK